MLEKFNAIDFSSLGKEVYMNGEASFEASIAGAVFKD
jgi:hypothetical protein